MYLRSVSTWRDIICTSDTLYQLDTLNPQSVRILVTPIHKIILPTSLGFSDVIVLKNCPSISSISNMSGSHVNMYNSSASYYPYNYLLGFCKLSLVGQG